MPCFDKLIDFDSFLGGSVFARFFWISGENTVYTKKVRFAIFYPTDPNPSKNTINIESYSEKNYFDGSDDRVSVQVYNK